MAKARGGWGQRSTDNGSRPPLGAMTMARGAGSATEEVDDDQPPDPNPLSASAHGVVAGDAKLADERVEEAGDAVGLAAEIPPR